MSSPPEERSNERMAWLENVAAALFANLHELKQEEIKFEDYHGFQKAVVPGDFKDSVLRRSGFGDFATRSVQVEIVKVDRPLAHEKHFHRRSDAIVVVLDRMTGFQNPSNALAYYGKAWIPVTSSDQYRIPRKTRHGFTVAKGGILYFLSVQSPPIKDRWHDDYVRVEG